MTLALIGLGILVVMILPLCLGLLVLSRMPDAVGRKPTGGMPIKARLGDHAVAVLRSPTGAARVHHSRSEEKRHDSRA